MLKIEKYQKLFAHLSLFLFFTLLFVLPKGYNYGATLLLVASVVFLFYSLYKKVGLFQILDKNKPIFMSVTFYFLVSLLFIFFYGEKIRLIDNPFRAFLFLSVIIFLSYSKLKFDLLLYIIPLGSFIAGVVALYQYYILHLPSAFWEQMKIQSGDIAMSLGLFSFIVSLYFIDINKSKFTLLSTVAGLFGVLASVLSFARGGWVGIPLIFFVVLYIYKNRISKKLVGVICLSILMGGVLLSNNAQFMDRILSVKSALTSYSNGVKDGSIGARLDMWKMGIDAFLEHPISGWNLKELENYKKELAEKGVVSPEFIQYTHFHNQFIDDTAKKGLLGGISLLGVFLIPLYFFYKKQKNHKESKRIKFITTLGIIHILSIMSYCITQAFLAHNSGNIFYFFLLVVFWAFMKSESEE